MNLSNIKGQVVLGAGIGALSAAALYALWELYPRKEKLPTDWRKVGTLSELMCFPIKSCGVVRMDSMNCTELGLQAGYLRDRDFTVVNSDRNFVSARIYPRMLLVKPTITESELILEAPDMATLTIPLKDIRIDAPTNATLFGKSINCSDCGDAAAEWFSKFILDKPSGLRLMHYPQDCNDMKRSRKLDMVKDGDSGAFPDLTSYCLINQSSLDDLNSRLDDIVTDGKRFRPNFIVKGPPAFEEDNWMWVRIGDVIFKAVKQCTRCVLTTVDADTGIKDKDGEPLKTLKTYRIVADTRVKTQDTSSPVMGIHLILKQAGSVKMGDNIYVA